MKTNFNIKTGSGRILRDVAATAALLLLSGFAASGVTLQDPTGLTWDCVMSGPREGLAYITFTTAPFSGALDPSGLNFSFDGTEIIVPKPQQQPASASASGRNAVGDTSRTGSTSGSTNSLNGTQIFGDEGVFGPWNYNAKGQVVGYFIEISKPVCTTNAFAVSTNGFPIITDPNAYPVLTNVAGFPTPVIVEFTNQLTCKALTNAISFTGTVVPGKHLTLVASTPFGKVTYKGVPMVAGLTNISGSWFGTKRQGGEDFNEFFTLTGGPLLYDVMGAGPGYSYTNAFAILSSQKKIAFSFGFDPDSSTVRATIGSFNSRKISGTTHGLEGTLGGTDTRLNFDAARTALPPAGP